MESKTRIPKSPYVLLASGFVLGAVCMAGAFNSANKRPAWAQADLGRQINNTSPENLATLHGLDESFQNLAGFVSPAVVEIDASNQSRMTGPNGARMPTVKGSGSGFIIRPDGYILTNDHVVGGFDKVTVNLKDGRSFDGKVIRAEDSDVAVVKIEAKDLPTLAFADSSKVRPGQLVMAVGAPFGLDQTFTFGHISAVGRLSQIQNRLYPDLIQTDTSINVGNSGGPLVNVDGQVVGVNTAIYSTTGVSAGVGFAIPGNQARFIGEKLITDGKITRALMGVVPENLKDIQKAELKLEDGAFVSDVSSDGPANSAGIKKGDVIVRVGKTTIRNQMDLRNAMLVYAPETTVEVEYIRDGQRKTTNVRLAKAPAAPATPQAPKIDDLPEGEFRFSPDMEKRLKEFFPNIPQFKGDSKVRQKEDADVPALGQTRPRLGISIINLSDEVRAKYSIPKGVAGVAITSVETGSIAEKNGFQEGDVIVSIDGKSVGTVEDLTRIIGKVNFGDTKKVKRERFAKGSHMVEEATIQFKR